MRMQGAVVAAVMVVVAVPVTWAVKVDGKVEVGAVVNPVDVGIDIDIGIVNEGEVEDGVQVNVAETEPVASGGKIWLGSATNVGGTITAGA